MVIKEFERTSSCNAAVLILYLLRDIKLRLLP